jgi:hypothetical protein
MRRHAFWISVFLFGALVLAKFSPHTGFTSLIRFGDTWRNHRHSALQNLPIAVVSGSNGYDGQFYATIALDPLLRGAELKEVIDAPVYRARRILAPAAAALLGLARPWWTLQAYALLNVICWFALGCLLHRRIAGNDWIAFARWAGCMFSMGVLDSVRQSLVDLPALLMLLLAVESHERPRPLRSAFWLALGNLTKETTVLGAIALHGDETGRTRWPRTIAMVLLPILPLLAWSLYVQQRLGGGGASAGLGNLSWPLLGLLTQVKYSLRELSYGNLDGRYSFGLLAILGLATQLVTLWRTPNLPSAWWRIGAAYSVLFFFLSFWVWSGYWAACRALLPMTIAFNLLLPAGRRFWPTWIVGNLTLLHAVWRFL